MELDESAILETGADEPAAPLGDARPLRTPALARGDLVADRYRVDQRIGCGGMASVYLAHHVEIEAAVAIKVLDPELAAMRGTAERFLLEAKASSIVHHPNVVAISDFGRLDDGLPYIVMEYLVGEDLEDVLRRTGPMPWSRVRAIALQVCAALQAAHDVGVIHRDVKLQNCFRQAGSGGQDFIKVLDFGIAKVTEDVLADRRALARTTEGIVVGTPDYMAPEQGRRGTVDHRADIYSLGVVLFHLVTGRLPFTAQHPVEQMAQHIYEAPPVPSELRPDLDPRVDAVILRALEKNPDDRYASMQELAEAIERIETSSTAVLAVSSQPSAPIRARRAGAMLGGAALVALLAVLWAARDGEPGPPPPPAPIPSAPAPAPAPTLIEAEAPVQVAAPAVELPVATTITPSQATSITVPEAAAPVLVLEPAPLEATSLRAVLQRLGVTDDDDVAEVEEPASETKRATRRRAKARARHAELPEPPQVSKPTRPAKLPPPSEAPSRASPPTPSRAPEKPASDPFRPVDPLKNPYD